MEKENFKHDIRSCGPAGAVYGLGIVGAAVYYVSHATGFWMGVIGFLKAIVWPAFISSISNCRDLCRDSVAI